MTSVSTGLKELMRETGMRQTDIIEKCKPYRDKYHNRLGKSDLSQYINGKVTPSQAKLKILADVLNVSEIWLMGLEDVPKSELDLSVSADSADLIDMKIAKIVTLLEPERKQEAPRYLQYLLATQ